jgi:hypothetical protein
MKQSKLSSFSSLTFYLYYLSFAFHLSILRFYFIYSRNHANSQFISNFIKILNIYIVITYINLSKEYPVFSKLKFSLNTLVH